MTASPVFALFVSLFISLSAIQTSYATATPEHRVDFSISLNGIETNLRLISASVMPGETLTIGTDAKLNVEEGRAERSGDQWNWKAPDRPGLQVLTFERNGETITLNVFVLTPFRNGKDMTLNGYSMGEYNATPFKGLNNYLPPRGFINMQPGMEDIEIAPHFKLGQFICKQQLGHEPTYLLVQTGMLVKLERLLEGANEKGWKADTFFIMSGFRTPFYNAAIGNKTTSSRHLFGDASDIYIDNDRDGVMDDLDGDGKITKKDAVALADLAKEIAEADHRNWPKGGIGIYEANAAHGPFVHIDARGFPARWGS